MHMAGKQIALLQQSCTSDCSYWGRSDKMSSGKRRLLPSSDPLYLAGTLATCQIPICTARVMITIVLSLLSALFRATHWSLQPSFFRATNSSVALSRMSLHFWAQLMYPAPPLPLPCYQSALFRPPYYHYPPQQTLCRAHHLHCHAPTIAIPTCTFTATFQEHTSCSSSTGNNTW